MITNLSCGEREYISPALKELGMKHEGILCSSANSIKDITFEFDEGIKE